MMQNNRLLPIIIFILFSCTIINGQDKISLKQEYSETLLSLTSSLLKLQINDKDDPNYGAIKCNYCNVLHTRAAESVYPMVVSYKITGNESYLSSALIVADWLIKQQQHNGSWKETPEEWTGTTTDQLLMMVLSYNLISDKLASPQKIKWRNSIEAAADYLASVMSNGFASINYCATTTASLASAYQLIPKVEYLTKSKDLARMIISKMDEDGFINGEGGKVYDAKFGVDLGYDLEMSLWGLGYYAKLTGDSVVNNAVKKSLANHLYFIYPDGSMDNSWGIRSNKWTTYGSATSDGCQVLFTLFADIDPRYPTAAYRNLKSIRNCIHDGILDFGPHYRDIFNHNPCIYPTFVKAKNLAFSYELAHEGDYLLSELPTDKINWLRKFNYLDVVEVRTGSFMSTITNYNYKDISRGSKSKYMFRPTGGCISNLWLIGHGYLQASSQTEYIRWEPMTFPVLEETKCLTPRIEFKDSLGYFTNLFEYDGHLETKESDHNTFEVCTVGELKDKNQYNGGVGYKLTHKFTDRILEKTATLFYRDSHPEITIVEPIIDYPGMKYTVKDSLTVLISDGNKIIEFKLLSNNARLLAGRDRGKYFSVFPSLKAFPIEVIIPPDNNLAKTISYQLKVVN